MAVIPGPAFAPLTQLFWVHSVPPPTPRRGHRRYVAPAIGAYDCAGSCQLRSKLSVPRQPAPPLTASPSGWVGAVLSMYAVAAVDCAALPEASVAIAVIWCGPSANKVVGSVYALSPL